MSTKDFDIILPNNITSIDKEPSGDFKYTFDKDDPNSMYKDSLLKNNARAYYY